MLFYVLLYAAADHTVSIYNSVSLVKHFCTLNLTKEKHTPSHRLSSYPHAVSLVMWPCHTGFPTVRVNAALHARNYAAITLPFTTPHPPQMGWIPRGTTLRRKVKFKNQENQEGLCHLQVQAAKC